MRSMGMMRTTKKMLRARKAFNERVCAGVRRCTDRSKVEHGGDEQ